MIFAKFCVTALNTCQDTDEWKTLHSGALKKHTIPY